jgi:hypothetical protein
MTTLTDRYVTATLRAVPEKSRGDLERELRASIEDAIEARAGKGEALDAAEIAVLTELGDPVQLAASYAGPPRYLIGPRVFHAYVRTLTAVLAFSVSVVWALFLTVWVVSGDSLLVAIPKSMAAALAVALLSAFWTTLGYAVVDSSESARQAAVDAFGAWTPVRLPAETSIRAVGVSSAVEAIVGGSICIALIFIQRSVSPFQDAAGAPIPVLNPVLWSSWIPVLIAIIAAWMVVEFIKLARGSWSVPIAIAFTLVTIASSSVDIYLLGTGQIFNPDFFERWIGTEWVAAGSPLVMLVIALNLIDCGSKVVRAWRATLGFGGS